MTDYGSPLQFGLSVTPEAADIDAIADLTRVADAFGLDLVAIQDHAYNQTFVDKCRAMTATAAGSKRSSW